VKKRNESIEYARNQPILTRVAKFQQKSFEKAILSTSDLTKSRERDGEFAEYRHGLSDFPIFGFGVSSTFDKTACGPCCASKRRTLRFDSGEVS